MEEGKLKFHLNTAFFLLLLSVAPLSHAKEEKQPKVNHDAIPPVISPDDPDMQKTVQDHLRIQNAKKADRITKNIRVGGKPIPSNKEQLTRERIYREKFDKNPRQTIPLKDCIKPNGVIDNEVNECMNGRIKKSW